jgi:hypothetical protein
MDYIWSNDKVVWNNKLQKMWIKAAVNYLRYDTSIHLEIIRKPTGNLGICRAQESKPGSYAYEAEMLTIQPGHSLSQRNYRKTTLLLIR